MNSIDQSSPQSPLLAAIDLGSNSFHMVIARLEQGELKPIEVMSEKVQLAAGLDSNSMLSDEAAQRGLDCLNRFAQRTQDQPRDSIRCVGTNALRAARNAEHFIEQAEKILGIPLEIIAGREEARLIFLGVSHTLPDNFGRRLVIDIGGGSTECIIGERFEPLELESLHMGCVSYNKRFFSNGRISRRRFKAARTAAQQELQSLQSRYLKHGWSSSVGSSGTIKAAWMACQAHGWCSEKLTREALQKLCDHILNLDHVDQIALVGIKPERCAVLPAGLAILSAVFDSLKIDAMDFSYGALREGLLYESAGRLRHEDVRQRTTDALMQRYHVDSEHALRVEATVLMALAEVKKDWQLEGETCHDMLSWAARTHEIGLTISHSGYHKHSAYLLANSDLPGFTRLDQQLLGTLVRGHRRKFPKDDFRLLPQRYQQSYRRLCVLLRLACILHRNRSINRTPAFDLKVNDNRIALSFPDHWLDAHSLTHADLISEQELLATGGFELVLS
ncbi:MAG: exopolyphosphatase [Marinobacterium sp.]|nr:exopolyphosphatase [Marinobacterium sp.]